MERSGTGATDIVHDRANSVPLASVTVSVTAYDPTCDRVRLRSGPVVWVPLGRVQEYEYGGPFPP